MKKSIIMALLLSGLCLTATAVFAEEKTPAFPGAEGFGRYVTGGRGGEVYHVTSLADDGSEGTLRWALAKGGTKTIVFDVSGTIFLKSALNLTVGNVTIAGQTAPGDGICIADYPFSIQAKNVIIRYLRFRLGNNNVTLTGADGWDGLGGMDQENIIVDHCSVSWSIDECLSVYGVKNATVQWCISSQSLQDAGHTKGSHGYGGNWGGSGITYHHNLMAHHESRVPRLGPRYTTQLDERMDMRNNVFYNWAGNGCYGGEAMNVNIVNNYYKPGPGTAQISTTKQKRIAAIGLRTNQYIENYPAYAPTLHKWGTFFVDGNVNSKYSDVTNDNWTNGIYNQINNSDNDNLFTDEAKTEMRLVEPIDFVSVTTHSAADAYARVLDYAGCSLKRDAVDELIISDTRNGLATYTGSGNHKGIIDSQNDNRPADASEDWSAWPTLVSTAAPADTDGDGMPDEWERANGLDLSDPKDGKAIGSDGYSNLERYLNSLVADITEAQNAGGEMLGSVVEESDEPIATSYELTPETANGDWTFSNGFSITNGAGKSYSPAKNCGIQGIKYSNNVEYIIQIPDGISITAVDIQGFCNENNVDGYLAKLGGKTFESTDYVFPSRTGGVSVTHNIALDQPASGSISFKFVKQECVRFILHTNAATSVINVIPDAADRKYYDLGGRRSRGNKGLVISKGIKSIKNVRND